MDVLRRGDTLNPKVKRSRSIIQRDERNQEQGSGGNHHQLVIYGNSFKNNSLGYAWNAYFDKNKIKKNIMVCCDLSKICDDILKGVENNSLTIKTFSFLLIGVCNIYKKKVYFIGQDYDFLKRKILSLYKNKDNELNDLTVTGKDSKRRKLGKDNEDDSNKSGSKKRLNRNSLNIKRGSIGLNELIPSVIENFTGRKSRFSLNADEISIAGTEHNSYNDMFNENEMNNQMLLEISGLNYLNFDHENENTENDNGNDHRNSNSGINNNYMGGNHGSASHRSSVHSSMGHYHDMEKALEGSYISRNSIPMNNFDGLHLNRTLSESFHNPMDNLNLENSILNNMIPKNMFSNLENSMNERGSMMGEFNDLELNSVHRSDGLGSMNRFNDGVDRGDNSGVNPDGSTEKRNLQNEFANVGGAQGFHHPSAILNVQGNENGKGVNPNDGNPDGNPYGNPFSNNLNGMTSTSMNFPNMPYNVSPGSNHFMGRYHTMNASMHNRNDLYNLNPFMSMHSMNNNNMDGRNSYAPYAQRIPNHNTFGDLDVMSNVMVGSMFTPQKKRNLSKKNAYLGALNFESYQNFDYFHQKDDDAFIKKLNTLLGLDDDDEGEAEQRGKNHRDDGKGGEEGEEEDDVHLVGQGDNGKRGPTIEGGVSNSKTGENDKCVNNQIVLNDEGEKEKDKEGGSSALNGSGTNQLVGKKRKLEKHIIDKNYMIKDAMMRGMLRNESVDYKHFLIDTINNEINEKMQKEYPSFQHFFLHSNTDKVRIVHKLEINFGYESQDCEKKRKTLENYLTCSVGNKSFLYENKNVFDHFSIKKCLDNIEESMASNENETLSNHFLSFDGEHEVGTMKSDNHMMHFEEVREQIDGMQFDLPNENHINEYRNRFSIDPSLSQHEQIDLNLNDLNMKDLSINDLNVNDLNVNDLNVNDLNVNDLSVNDMSVNDLSINDMNIKDYMGSRLHLDSQISKSLVPYGENGSVEKNDELAVNGNFLNDRLNSEFTPSSASPHLLDLSMNSNYNFSDVFTKDNESSFLDDKSVQVEINLNQDFDLIAKELLEVYKNLSTKINYIFFDLITKNRQSKDEVAVLFYITLHLANLGYINIVQKPILAEQLSSYGENSSRPILIQYMGQRDD
ncbi:hypothetical protein C922_00387 [Plasmodium inui San Antonio 1]|uniref:Rad21/Rec8-like protein N-terminal domain-containing protein n=1 Tax=Plasmodium inui San Antonio 1 TaxID=1237626 RepID=W7AL82_9APIC|nr:hypothetical protein C922_00387 [Plasmodium inui San Antonio 1]EUD69524.1 hypothetical protein C922_00387 [Plasmodium inui San Antonio 1]